MIGRIGLLCALAYLLLYSPFSYCRAGVPTPANSGGAATPTRQVPLGTPAQRAQGLPPQRDGRAAVAQVIAAATEAESADGARPALPPTSSPPASLVTGVLGMALKLALVLALAYVASLALRRFGSRWRSRPGISADSLAVLGTLTLGQGRVIYVLAVGTRRLLIGATAQQLTLLGDFTADLVEPAGSGDPALQGEG